jgi:hypothetical protein
MDRSYTEQLKDNINDIWKAFVEWLDQKDAASWPAFFVFLGVVTLGMVMNYIAFLPVIGSIPALIVSILFEVAIVAWKITSDRRRNDKKQNQLSVWATWSSVALAISMLVVNLFRIGGENFDNLAYGIVGAAACAQVVFYLLFDNANPDKSMEREHNQGQRGILRKTRNANYVIGDAAADLKIVRYIATELRKLQNEFSDLPTELQEVILNRARLKLLAEYAAGKDDIEKDTRKLVDLNRDGKIGADPIVGRLPIIPPTVPEELPFIPEPDQQEDKSDF